MKDNICLSGGAKGADLQFGMTAGMRGDQVVHWSFAGAKSEAPVEELVILTPDQLEVADKFLKRANRTLKRSIGRPGFVRKLLQRNWYQVEHSERVYAVAHLEGGQVSGGTAWATQMFIDRWNGQPCECYVYDQIVEAWYAWKGEWSRIETPPEPYGVWTGIGSRNLLPSGKQAIRTLLRYQPVKP